MTLKACTYKNCDNYINLRDRTFNEHITLFNFPKNPERRQIWIENGKAPPNLSPSMYCYCSDHFDKRFLAINNRRTVLVGEAVPYPYVDQVFEENYDEENLDCYLYEMKEDGNGSNGSSGELIIEQEQLQEQDIHVESTTSMQGEDQTNMELLKNEFNVDHTQESASDQYIMHMENVKESKEPNKSLLNNLKRKLNDSSVTLTPASSSKQMMLKKSSPTKQQQSPKTLHNKYNIKPTALATAEVNTVNIIRQTDHVIGSVLKESEIDTDSLVDTQHVTTFIFKGEEYVQMPRDHYIAEKIDLMKKLDKLERVVKAIKGHLNNIEF